MGCCFSHERGLQDKGYPDIHQQLDGITDASDESVLREIILGGDFSYDGHTCLAKVVDVYDGDTIRIAFIYNGIKIQYKSRMAGFDSPEMKPLLSKPNREIEKAAAIVARDALRGKILNQVVNVKCGKFDKYGRVLITVHLYGENINQWMLANGYGVPYNGGTKPTY